MALTPGLRWAEPAGGAPAWQRACRARADHGPGSAMASPPGPAPLFVPCAGALARAPADAAPQWLLLDGEGRLLDTAWPLAAAAPIGQGLVLQLWQRRGAGAAWSLLRWVHLGPPDGSQAAWALLARAVASLLQQALADRALGVPAMPLPDGRQPGAPGHSGPGDRWRWRLAADWRGWCAQQAARWQSEFWSVGLVDAPVDEWVRQGGRMPVRWISRPTRDGYHADPMGLPGDDRRLFCERFDERTGLGFIERLTLDGEGRVRQRERLGLDHGRHVSFPLVVRLRGRLWGLLESVDSGDCQLFAVDARGRWQPHATLLRGVRLADPALFEWQGRFWLAGTDVGRGAHDNLCLFHADDLAGPWSAHANNPVKVDIAGARMAGGLFQLPGPDGGVLVRPAQDCLGGYGRAVQLQRVLRCTPTEYAEEPLLHIGPEVLGPGWHGLHTVSAWGGRTLIDAKRHGINPVAVARKLGQRLRGRRLAPAPGRRVFIYLPWLRLGGGETSLLRLAEGFLRDGLDTTLVVHGLEGAELAVPPGLPVLTLGSRGTLGSVRRLALLLREHRPTWLLSGFPHTNVAAVAAVAWSNVDCRCVVTEHAPLQQQIAQQGGWRYRLLPPLVRWAYRRADAVVAVSGGVRDDLRELIGPGLQPQVIGNPVIDEQAGPGADATPLHPWLQDAGLQVVLSVSRLSEEKGLPVLVDAFARLHAQQPHTRLLLAGDGPQREALQALLQARGLAEVAALPGRVQWPMGWMQRAAVFALASRFEGFGNVLIEAMASGTPVVSTDCPVGPRELLAGGRWGTLVPVDDAAALARALGQALRRRSPPRGADAHARQFTVGRASAAYRQLFDRLVGSPC